MGLLLTTLKQGYILYVAMFLLSLPYEALHYVAKDLIFCQTISALMDVDSLEECLSSLEPVLCPCKNVNGLSRLPLSNSTPFTELAL